MNQSINEPRPDGKVPPKVGAVLLFPDGRIETAYRGELREGDHAEFTLIERKLAKENLQGSILFTTLEPCVERNSPKVPCCRRTTNARIKKVYVGVTDPDPTVDGKGIKHLELHGVEVKWFDSEFRKVIQEENKAFLEQALERKQNSKIEDLRNSIEFAIPTFDSSKFSEAALKKFIVESKLDYQTTDQSFFEYLTDFGAVEWNNETKQFVPTGYGILLFGENPRAKFKNAVLKAHVEYGNKKIEAKDFEGALVLLPEQIEAWLKKVLPLSKDTSSFKRKDVPDFPIEVLREAIVNALVHRDYEIEGAKCEIKIDENKIVVTSPGKPLPSISLDELNAFEAPSLSRNPIITYVFNLMNYVEEKGFGMKTFKSLYKNFGLSIPQYKYKAPFLTLTFARTIDALKDLNEKEIVKSLSNEEVIMLEIFRNNKQLSKSEFADLSNLSHRTAERYIKHFVDLKLIKVIGGGKYTKYEIVK